MLPVLATLLLAPRPADAAGYSSMYGMEKLIDAADDVVVGRVDAKTASLMSTGLIETEVRLVVEDAHRDASRHAASFWLPGGQVGDTVLTIPGTPHVSVGDRLMVFLDDGKPVGLAQGVWTSVDGGFTAASSAQSDSPRIDTSAVMGDTDTVQDCLDAHQQVAQEDGWSLRSRLTQGNRQGTSRGLVVSLLAGLEYRLTVCGDGFSSEAWAQVMAPDERLVGESEVHKQGAAMVIKPDQTGLHMVVIGAEDLEDGAWRTRFGVGLAYR